MNIDPKHILDTVQHTRQSNSVKGKIIGGPSRKGSPPTVMVLHAADLHRLLVMAKSSPTQCVALPEVGFEIKDKDEGGKRWTEFHLFSAAPTPHALKV